MKIEIGNNYSYIKDFIPEHIYQEISNTLSYKVLNCEWTASYNTIKNDGTRKWDGRKRLIKKNKKYIKFPTGLMGRVIKILKKHNYKIQYSDKRPRADDVLKNVTLNGIKKPRPYQDESTDKAIDIGRGIIKAPTGSGKTFMAALMFSKKPCKRFVFFVLSIDLLKQTKTEFEEVLLQNGSPLEVGTVGDGTCDIKDVTIVSIKTACGAFNIKYKAPNEDEKKDDEEVDLNAENKEKIRDLITNCQFIIFDEVHHAPCDTVQDVLEKCREARYRFGLSVFADSHIYYVNNDDFNNYKNSKIEDLWYQIEKTGIKSQHEYDYEIKDLSTLNISSRGWDENGFSWKKIKKIIRHINNKKSYKIKFKNKYLKVTKDHSLFRLNNGDLEVCKPEQMQIGDLCFVDILASNGQYNISIVEDIEEIEPSDTFVYDLEMDGHPSFVANDILVHNSASPWRDDNADLEIESFFGRNIVDISASYLIRNGYLVKPYIYFISQEYESQSSKMTYQNIYKNFITENEERNDVIKKVVEHLKKQGRTILILVKVKKHGKKLEDEIPDSIFIHGGHSGNKREDVLNKLRKKEIRTVISTSIFDQGIDVRALDALVLTASGKSSTRALQRIGRVIRKYENKENAIIIDFNDKIKYLSSHYQARRKIYKTEEEFEINDVEFEDVVNDNFKI